MLKKYHSNPELNKGPINKMKRNEIQKQKDIIWDSNNNTDAALQRMAERNQKVGNNEFTGSIILEGSRDRLLSVPYNPNKYSNKQSQGAYHEGFFEHGNREILGKLEMLSEEELTSIGYNDHISGIKMSSLPEKVKKNTSYALGYLSAAIEKSNKKSR